MKMFDNRSTKKFHLGLKKTLPDLWRYAFALSGNREKADDIVQDCAERAIRKQRQWNSAQPIKPWLMTIVLNIYRNQYRRDTFLRLVPIEDSDHIPPWSPEVENRQDLAATMRGIDRLPPEQREALLSVVVGGLDYAQAATTLNIAQGTLMSRIFRARKKLKQMRHQENETIRRIK